MIVNIPGRREVMAISLLRPAQAEPHVPLQPVSRYEVNISGLTTN